MLTLLNLLLGKKKKKLIWLLLKMVAFVFAFAIVVVILFITVDDITEKMMKLENALMEEEINNLQNQVTNNSPSLTSDTSLNLLLLDQAKNAGYLKELFGLYKITQDGQMYYGQQTPGPSVEFLFAQHMSETTLGTYIPMDANGIYQWNKPYQGYPAEAMTWVGMNSNVLTSKYASKLNLPGKPTGTLSTASTDALDKLPTVGYFQIMWDYFTSSGNPLASTPSAGHPSLKPHGITDMGKRLSDPFYLPDQLSYLGQQYTIKWNECFPESFRNTKNDTPETWAKLMAPIMSLNHGGAANIKNRVWYGLGYNITKKGVGLKISDFTLAGGPDEYESYYQFGKDLMIMQEAMPKDFVVPDFNSYAGKSLVHIIPLVCTNDYYINNNGYKMLTESTYFKGGYPMYKAVAQLPNATEADYKAFLKSKTKEPEGFAQMCGVNEVHNQSAVWRYIDGTITRTSTGVSTKRIQLHTYINWGQCMYGSGLAIQSYGNLLTKEGVPGVVQTDVSTYTNTVGGIQNAVTQNPITPPNQSSGQQSTVKGTLVHNWVYYHDNNVPGKILEVAWKDGMPVFYQNLNRGPLAKYKIPKHQYPKSLKGPFTYNSNSYDTLCWSGCGMVTMTSILHGIGKGNNPEIAGMVDEGTGETNLFSPADLMHYYSYLSSSKFPYWYTSMGMSHSVAVWFNYMGIPARNFSTRDTAALKQEMAKKFPLIVSSPNRCKYSFYEYTDDTKKKVTKRLSNKPLTTGGHIVAFYGLYTLEVDTGGVKDFVALMDSSNHKAGVLHMFVPIEELSQISYSVLIESPLTQLGSTTPQGSTQPTAPVPAPKPTFKPSNDKRYWENIDKSLLDMPYDLKIGTSNLRRIKVPAVKDIKILYTNGDIMDFKQVAGNRFNLVLYRDDLAYVINNVTLAKPPQGNKMKVPLTKDVDLVFPNSTTVNITVYNTDSSYKLLSPYEETASIVT